MPSGANCKTGVCDCADGHTYVRGRCRPLNGLDQYCDTDLDCYFGYDRQSVACHNQVCTCATGYYRRNGNICRRESMEKDDACVVDTDCVAALGANAKCESLTCQYGEVVETTSRPVTTEASKPPSTETATATQTQSTLTPSPSTSTTTITSALITTTTTNVETTANIETTTTTTTPSETASTSQETSALVNGRNYLTDTETETEPERAQHSREIAVQTSIEAFELKSLTPLVKNVGTVTASTSTSTSRRAPRYYRRRQSTYRIDDDDKTFSTLSNTDTDDLDDRKFGSFCTENGKSCTGLPHSVCANSVCLCKQGYYPKNGICFAELGEIAETADECEHAFDELSKKCICQKNYFYERNLRVCRKPIQYHLSCTSHSQCSPFGAAFCTADIPRRCKCDEYAQYDELQQMCVYKQGLGAQCDTDENCPVQHSTCSNSYCVCKENFLEKNDVCVAGVGAQCEADVECAVNNSTCAELPTSGSEEKDRACQCKKGYVHFKDECHKEAEELEDECVDTEQCKPLLGTCIDQKCSCTPEQHFKYGRCEDKKGINEPCARAGECFIEEAPENIECRNSVCQCKFGYQSDAQQKHCIRVMPNKKNSSGRPSALKIITFLLIGSAFLITSAAIKQAYY